MNPVIGSRWTRVQTPASTRVWEVKSFDSDTNKVNLSEVGRTMSSKTLYKDTLFGWYKQVKDSAPTWPVVGSLWRSKLNSNLYTVDSVEVAMVNFSSGTQVGRGTPFKYSFPRFHKTLAWVSDPQPAKLPQETVPEVGSVWETNGSRRYVVDRVNVEVGPVGDPNYWYVSFHYEGQPQHSYSYNAEKFWRLLKFVEPAPDKWAEVERTLRTYNAANRESVRLDAEIKKVSDLWDAAIKARDLHRKVVGEASAAYSEALRKMEDSVK